MLVLKTDLNLAECFAFFTQNVFWFLSRKWNVKFSMHGLHSRYREEKNKMIAVNHKLLE